MLKLVKAEKNASKVSAWLSMGCVYSRFHLPSATHLQNFVLQSGAFHLSQSGYITLIIPNYCNAVSFSHCLVHGEDATLWILEKKCINSVVLLYRNL